MDGCCSYASRQPTSSPSPRLFSTSATVDFELTATDAWTRWCDADYQITEGLRTLATVNYIDDDS